MFLFTVSEEGSVVLLVIGILISCGMRLSYTIKDLSTLNIVEPLLRDTCLGKKGEPAVYGIVLFLLSPPDTCQPCPANQLAVAHHHLLVPNPVSRVLSSHRPFPVPGMLVLLGNASPSRTLLGRVSSPLR